MKRKLSDKQVEKIIHHFKDYCQTKTRCSVHLHREVGIVSRHVLMNFYVIGSKLWVGSFHMFFDQTHTDRYYMLSGFSGCWCYTEPKKLIDVMDRIFHHKISLILDGKQKKKT